MSRKNIGVLIVLSLICLLSGCSQEMKDSKRNEIIEDNIQKVESYYSEQSMKNPYSNEDVEAIKASMEEAIGGYNAYDEVGETYICNGAIVVQLKSGNTWYMFQGDISTTEEGSLVVSDVMRLQLFE